MGTKAELLSRRFKAHPGTIVVLGFALADLVGAAFLELPCMQKAGVPFLDALFTSTSAVCVTGLSVVNVAQAFTRAGQFLIMLLMQVGGLGVMTFSVFIFFTLGQPLRLSHRVAVQESFLGHPVPDIWSLVKTIMLFTFVTEAVSGCVLTVLFCRWMGLPSAAFNGFFHAVSAFCNGGFSTFRNGLVPFRDDWPVCTAVMLTILMGNTGFAVVYELAQRLSSRRKPERLSLHFRLTVTTHLCLVAVGALGIFFFERDGLLSGLPLDSRLLVALFHSVSARTAGFNTVDVSMLTEDSLYLILLLMFVGACPGSTGGGLRTTTFAVLVTTAVSRLRGFSRTTVARRSIPESVVERAMVLFMLFIVSVIVGHVVLMMVGPNLPFFETRSQFLAYLFEAVSALCTVGLSAGVTTQLGGWGKLVLILMMFVGRVGLLSVLSLLVTVTAKPRPYYSVAEDVRVG